jgi:hypothetical protein
MKSITLGLIVALVLTWAGCGSGGSKSSSSQGGTNPSPSGTNQASSSTNAPSTDPSNPASTTLSTHHIFVFSEENTSYGSVVGNTSQMPFLNSLLEKGTLWSNYYSNHHGSMLSYIETVSGQSFDCSGNDCVASGHLTGPSLMDVLDSKGMTWKGYFDGLSKCGELAPQSTNWIINPDSNGKQNYYQRHTPYPWFATGTATIPNCSTNQNGWWGIQQFSTDLANHTVGDLNWLTPDGTSDGHDGSLEQLDTFAKNWLTPLLNSSYFQPGGDGILIIWWDEASLSDDSCGGPGGQNCGGHIPMMVIGPGIRANNTDDTSANHDSVSRFIQQQLGLTPTLGKSVSVPDFTNTLAQ